MPPHDFGRISRRVSAVALRARTGSSSLLGHGDDFNMPGIDFACVRSRVGMAMVLELAGFQPVEASGHQIRGPCPIHKPNEPTSRSFSANLRKNTFRCFKCGAGGNQLDLWIAISGLPIHAAAEDLCNRLGIEVPTRDRR